MRHMPILIYFYNFFFSIQLTRPLSTNPAHDLFRLNIIYIYRIWCWFLGMLLMFILSIFRNLKIVYLVPVPGVTVNVKRVSRSNLVWKTSSSWSRLDFYFHLCERYVCNMLPPCDCLRFSSTTSEFWNMINNSSHGKPIDITGTVTSTRSLPCFLSTWDGRNVCGDMRFILRVSEEIFFLG